MYQDFLNVMIWIDIRACLPFTLLAIGLCFMVHLDHHPVAYYVNLLIANLIQLITLIFIATENKIHEDHLNFTQLFYSAAAMVSLYFRMIIAMERCSFIIWPQLHLIRQAKGSVIICVLFWMLCMMLFHVSIIFDQSLIFIFALIPSSIFIFCSLGTLIFLPGATSISPEGRRRIVEAIFLLMLKNILTIAAPVIVFLSYLPSIPLDMYKVLLTLFLFSPFMDLFLFVFMRKGPIDNFLSCLCCCKMETSAVDDSKLST